MPKLPQVLGEGAKALPESKGARYDIKTMASGVRKLAGSSEKYRNNLVEEVGTVYVRTGEWSPLPVGKFTRYWG
jgi:hypothetical protein